VVPKKNPFATAADLKMDSSCSWGQCARSMAQGEGGKSACGAPRIKARPRRRALFVVIRDGIKGNRDAGQVYRAGRACAAAYVRSSAGSPGPEKVSGDPNTAKSVERPSQGGRCVNVHINGGQGRSLAPESRRWLRAAAPLICGQRSSTQRLLCRKTSYRCERLRRMDRTITGVRSTRTSSPSRFAI